MDAATPIERASANYSALGLNWHIAFDCPELNSAPAGQPADVVVKLGDVPARLEKSRSAGPLTEVTAHRILFRFPGVARYLIDGPHRITIEPLRPLDHQLRLFLFGTVAAQLLLQHGRLPLHASGIATSRGAVLFAGHSGYGKSTLLSAFLQQGYPMITDDLAAVTVDHEAQQVTVAPGFPNMKLWADALAHLGQPSDTLQPVRTAALAKYSVPIDQPLITEPLPLYAMYVLNPRQEAAIKVEPLPPAKQVNEVINHTWQKMALKRQGRHLTHFQQITQLVRQTRVVRVSRPEGGFLIDALVEALEADFRR